MKTINLSLLLFCLLIIPGLSSAQADAAQQLNPEDVITMLDNGAIFVDVRETNEVDILTYDLPGVINLPLSELPERMAELPKDQPIVLACRSGKRSLKAVTLLAENNFTQLHNLTGGIIAWEAAEMPVVKMPRTAKTTATGKACCSAKGQGAGKSCGSDKEGEDSGKSCSGDKEGEASAKASCGEKGKGKGKSCCSGAGR